MTTPTPSIDDATTVELLRAAARRLIRLYERARRAGFGTGPSDGNGNGNGRQIVLAHSRAIIRRPSGSGTGPPSGSGTGPSAGVGTGGVALVSGDGASVGNGGSSLTPLEQIRMARKGNSFFEDQQRRRNRTEDLRNEEADRRHEVQRRRNQAEDRRNESQDRLNYAMSWAQWNQNRINVGLGYVLLAVAIVLFFEGSYPLGVLAIVAAVILLTW